VQHNVIGLVELCNPQALAIRAYIDSIELWFPPSLRSEQYRDLRCIGRIKPCRDHRGRLWGYRFFRNKLDLPTLLLLDRKAQSYRGILSRFDLAIDIQAPSFDAANFLEDLILRTALLRWRHPGPMDDQENGTNWSQWNEEAKRTNRNLTLYADRHNRFTDELNCVHFELRFLRPHIIRAQGIHRVKDMLDINPKDLFDRHVKFSDLEVVEDHVLKIVRETVRDERERHLAEHAEDRNAFTDAYRANISNRVAWWLHRFGYDRAQELHGVKAMKAITSPLTIPITLTWQTRPLKTNNIFQKRGNSYD